MARDALPRGFQRLLAATCSSNFGDGLRMTALPLLVASVTRDPVAIGAVSAATTIPWLLGPIGGTMVDRGDRVRLMVIGQFMRALAVTVLVLAIATGMHALWLIYVVAVLVGLGEVVVDSAAQALVPALVNEPQLEQANGRIAAGMTVTGEVVGGPVGGLLFTLGATVPFVLDAASFLTAGLLLAALRVPERRIADRRAPRTIPALVGSGTTSDTPRPRVDGDGDDRRDTAARADRRTATPRTDVGDTVAGAALGATTTFWQDVHEGMLTLWRDKLLRSLAVIVGLVNVGVTGSLSILVLLALGELGLDELGFGLLLGAGAVGGLIGSLLAARIRRKLGRPYALMSASVSVAIGMVLLARAASPVAAAVGVAIISMAGGVFSVVGLSLRQAIIPPELLGRVIASFRVIGIGGVPVGAFLGGFLARATDVRTTMTASAVLLTLVAFGMLRTVRLIPAEHR